MGDLIGRLDRAGLRGLTGRVFIVGEAALMVRTLPWEDRAGVAKCTWPVDLVVVCDDPTRARVLAELVAAGRDVLTHFAEPADTAAASSEGTSQWFRVLEPVPVAWADRAASPRLTVEVPLESEMAAYVAGAEVTGKSPLPAPVLEAGSRAAALARLDAEGLFAAALSLWGSAAFTDGTVEALRRAALKLTAATP